MVFGSKKPKYEYNFHDDELLHDNTPQAKAWNSNLLGDAATAAKIAANAMTKGWTGAAREVLGDLDLNDPLNKFIEKEMVSQLWGSMLHPPQSFRGPDFQYRKPDGSNNNFLYPQLGAARTPYAKTVYGVRPTHGAKPDPGDLFDLLMARDNKDGAQGIESSSGFSSMLLCHASLIIHDIFRTDDDNPNISATSSYLDLAPLYGSCEKTQNEVRLLKNGLLKPDTFSEQRLLRQPPGVCIYLIMYNRFHNYVAKQLLELNENGRFSLPASYDSLCPELKAAADKKLDDDLFNTARLITCGLYIQIAIHDYLRCLMLMHTKDTPFTLDPRTSLPERNNKKGLQRGEGNMVSVEFNLLYRFHSPISNREAAWSEDVFVQTFRDMGMLAENEEEERETAKPTYKGRPKYTIETIKNGEIPVPKFKAMMDAMRRSKKAVEQEEKNKKCKDCGKCKKCDTDKTEDERKREQEDQMKKKEERVKQGQQERFELPFFPAGLDTVGGWSPAPGREGPETYRFKRGKDGKFDDAQLAAEMIRVMEDPICQFGAQNVPKVFKAVEVLGILQARQWEVATLNEFREFFGMSRHTHFEDINSDKEIQQHLRDLYQDPDLVELYPGLFCEGQGRCLDPSVACPGQEATSLWRAVFSDAVTLVRSDRFYTLDWNVGSLTAWGMKEVTSDPMVNKGSVMHRLFQRAFPGFFSYNSVHMWQPFYTATKNVQLAQQQNKLRSLDLQHLEDQNGKPWKIRLDEDGNVLNDFVKECSPKNGKKVRRTLELHLPERWLDKDWEMQIAPASKIGYAAKSDYPWRGAERATKVGVDPITITDYDDVCRVLLGSHSKDWISPSIREETVIPKGPLREIMTKTWDDQKWRDATRIIQDVLGSEDWRQSFMEYFMDLSQVVRRREQREFKAKDNSSKKAAIYQIDVVADYAVPVVTRFVADFLGFWPEVKTPEFPERRFSENQIYKLLENCQNFDSYDADPAKAWAQRMAFEKSIADLMTLADTGITGSEPHFFENGFLGLGGRSYGTSGDSSHVKSIRMLAVKIVKKLREKFSHEEVVAVMLSTALDAAQKAVVTFTEALAYFIDPQRDEAGNRDKIKLWSQVQDLAWGDVADVQRLVKGDRLVFQNKPETAIKLRGYILEAQRYNSYMRIPRVCNANEIILKGKTHNDKLTVKRGQVVLLDLFNAYQSLPQDSEVFPKSHHFNPARDQSSYLIYGDEKAVTRELALIAITALIKHAAQLNQLRVAHDKLGRLKRVTTPLNVPRYATVQWDTLLPSPATWNLRYDDVGKGIYKAPDNSLPDNANQGHGAGLVCRIPKLPAVPVTSAPVVQADSPPARPVEYTEVRTTQMTSLFESKSKYSMNVTERELSTTESIIEY